MKQAAHEEFAACVGLDWADTKQDVCLQAAGSEKRARSILEHTPEAIEAWGCSLHKRCEGKPIALCLELHKGPIVFALRKYHVLVLLPVNPLPLARYREALTPSRAKDDPTDADLQLAWRRTHRDKLQPLTPQRPTMRALEQRVDHRRRVVGDKGRIPNRLTSTLKNYFPHVLQWFQDKDTLLFCDFLSRWPTLKAVQLARRSPRETFLREHHVRSADVMTQRLDAIKAAIPLTTEEGIIPPHARLVQALVSQLRAILHAIQDFDKAIAQRAQSHPDFPLFQPLPGAGPVFAPRLLVAFGEPRDRSASAAELQQFAGIAPVTERSGKQCWVHWRFQGPTFLRPTCVAWAAASIQHSFWAQVYDQQHREKGKAPQAAVRPLAFKWIRILFRCWQDRTPYDEAVYLNALHSRGASLIHNLGTRS